MQHVTTKAAFSTSSPPSSLPLSLAASPPPLPSLLHRDSLPSFLPADPHQRQRPRKGRLFRRRLLATSRCGCKPPRQPRPAEAAGSKGSDGDGEQEETGEVGEGVRRRRAREEQRKSLFPHRSDRLFLPAAAFDHDQQRRRRRPRPRRPTLYCEHRGARRSPSHSRRHT